MRSFLSRRWAAALLLTVLLAALTPGLVLAGSSRPAAKTRQTTPSVLSLLGDWLHAFVEKNGAELDPSGAPRSVNVSPVPPAAPAATTDNGAEVDPNGRR